MTVAARGTARTGRTDDRTQITRETGQRILYGADASSWYNPHPAGLLANLATPPSVTLHPCCSANLASASPMTAMTARVRAEGTGFMKSTWLSRLLRHHQGSLPANLSPHAT